MEPKILSLFDGINYKKAKNIGSTVFVPVIGTLPNASTGIDLADETIDKITISELKNEDVNNVNIKSNHHGSVLIMSGMVLIGGRQIRTPIRPFIIKKGTKKKIPVNCIEQGRWSYTAEDAVDNDRSKFKVSKRMVSRKTRSSYTTGGHTQSQTWGSISNYMIDNEISTEYAPTQSYLAVERAVREKESERLGDIRKKIENEFNLENQRGILVFEKGELVSMEVYDNPEYWNKIKEQVLESNLLDLLSSEKEETCEIKDINFDSLTFEKVDNLVNEDSFQLKMDDMNGWAIGIDNQIIYASLNKFEGKESGEIPIQTQMNADQSYRQEIIETSYEENKIEEDE